MKKLTIFFRMVWIVLIDPWLTISLLKNLVILTFARLGCLFSGKKFITIALTEQLGDIVAAEPIADYMRMKYRSAFICWVIDRKYAPLVQTNQAITKTIRVSCLSEWIILKHFLSTKSIYDLHINNKGCSRHQLVNVKANPYDITLDNYFDKGNLLYAFSRSAGIDMPANLPPHLHIQPRTEGTAFVKSIVMHTSTNNPEKIWKDECWNKLASFILTNFNDHHIVEIGFQKKLQGVDKRVLNYTGEKELSQIAGLIRDSVLFIGLDSGFAHFANALNKESVILLGSLGPFEKYMPYSGKFEEEKEDTIVYHPGPLSAMPCNHVFSLVSKKLKP